MSDIQGLVQRLRDEAEHHRVHQGQGFSSTDVKEEHELMVMLNEAAAEIERLCLPPDETMSDYPGCVYCMEKDTPIRLGMVCPKCGDRLPTKREYDLQRQEKVYAVCTGEVVERWETYTLHDKPPPLCDYEVLYRTAAARTEPTTK